MPNKGVKSSLRVVQTYPKSTLHFSGLEGEE